MRRRVVTSVDVLGRHPVHPFPARMAPALVVGALEKLRPGSVVLDPMAGSGTVLAIARARGFRTVGFDVDPLAVLIARVWTSAIEPSLIRTCAGAVLDQAREVAAKPLRDSFPAGADEETRAFIRYWFDPSARRQMTALSLAISNLTHAGSRDVLWCALSRMIITKQAGVSRAIDLAHSRPHRGLDKGSVIPFDAFAGSVERVIAGCIHRRQDNRGPSSKVNLGDVRDLPLESRSVDLVFTSPPYLNAIDYLRCSKFSLVWMGHSIKALRVIRSNSIGTESSGGAEVSHAGMQQLVMRLRLTDRNRGIIRRYANDTFNAAHEIARVLKPRGRAVFVVGENTIGGVNVPTATIVARMAEEAGLELVARGTRSLPRNRRYLPPPRAEESSSLSARMKREVILTFERT